MLYMKAMKKEVKKMQKRISKINEILEKSGSIFRTKDGVSVCAYIGHLTFLKKTYSSIDELEDVAKRIGGAA